MGKSKRIFFSFFSFMSFHLLFAFEAEPHQVTLELAIVDHAVLELTEIGLMSTAVKSIYHHVWRKYKSCSFKTYFLDYFGH